MAKFYTQEQMKALRDKFFRDPEWHLVSDMFHDYLEPLKDIDYLDISDTNESVKGEIRARKHMYALVSTFFSDAKLLAEGSDPIKKDPRDSNE